MRYEKLDLDGGTMRRARRQRGAYLAAFPGAFEGHHTIGSPGLVGSHLDDPGARSIARLVEKANAPAPRSGLQEICGVEILLMKCREVLPIEDILPHTIETPADDAPLRAPPLDAL